jgi:glyoxylase-like metal-dependent hydrolase (beta-lactamase superfamily II)
MANSYRIQLGTSNAYLIQGDEGCILVDAGNPRQEKRFFRYLDQYGLRPEDVRLIVVTHVHFDHVGSLGAIKAACRCPVAVHEKEYRLLKEAELVFPPGTNLSGKGTSLVANRLLGYPPIMKGFKFAPVEAEIVISGEVSLEKFGIDGKIIPTPGHSAGSLSVLLADGEAFVGDLTANYVPLGLSSVFPPFAEDGDELLESWMKLLEAGAKTIAPGHGRTFSAEVLREEYNRRKR